MKINYNEFNINLRNYTSTYNPTIVEYFRGKWELIGKCRR